MNNADSAAVTITAPTTGRPWLRYNLTLCTLAGGAPTADCVQQTCADAQAADFTTSCAPLGGLEASTAYGVAVVAERVNSVGKAVLSTPAVATFTTPAHE